MTYPHSAPGPLETLTRDMERAAEAYNLLRLAPFLTLRINPCEASAQVQTQLRRDIGMARLRTITAETSGVLDLLG